MRGFRNFLMRGDVIVLAIGLVVALAFSNLISAFTDYIITPIVAAAEGNSKSPGLGFHITSNSASFVNIGKLISAIIYFVIFMAVVYFVIVMPYKRLQARRGQVVFGDPAPVKTCPACLSSDLPTRAAKCKYCGTEQPPVAA